MKHSFSFAIGVLVGISAAIASTNLRADDIEVYTGAGASGLKPNILFILDTSSSMLQSVTMTYDPNTTYPGPCPTTYNGQPIVYMKYGSTTPPSESECTNLGEGTSTTGNNYWFYKSALHCDDAIQRLATTGTWWNGRVAAWQGSYWTTPYRGYHSRPVECAADAGRHGEGDTDGNGENENPNEVYATIYVHVGSQGAWTADSAMQLDYSINSGSTFPYRYFFDPNYVNFVRGWHQTTNRINVMKQVLKELIDETDNARLALMRFDVGDAQCQDPPTCTSWGSGKDGDGGMVIASFVDASDPANKTTLKDRIDQIYIPNIPTGTQLHETLAEAARYFAHDKVARGIDSHVFEDPVSSTSNPTSDDFVPLPSVPDSRRATDPSYYDTGMIGCEKNFIIYLTDGAPTADGWNADENYTGSLYYQNTGSYLVCNSDTNDATTPEYSCLDDLSYVMRNFDINKNLEGKQTVTTFTIGFFVGNQLLATTAANGGGKYYTVNSYEGLKNSIKDALNTIDVIAVNSSFTIPAVTVNSFNRVSHLDELFFSLFKPSNTQHWPGNLKKYRIRKNSSTGEAEIVDAYGNPAIDPVAGFFRENATSFWTSGGPDGGETELGGAAQQLATLSSRKVYTYLGANSDLTNSDNSINEGNVLIDRSMVGAADDTERSLVLQWARGIDVKDQDNDTNNTEFRQGMGDPLHATPVTVVYGGTSDNPEYAVYVATNDGYLHAFDGQTGQEYFAFIPQELLPNLGELYRDELGSKLYGLDGGIVPLIHDENHDGIINGSDYVHLIIGMRRGGNNYYALDVTDRTAPRLLWQITGGQGDFTHLGQSWSEPVPAKVNIDGTVHDVLIFGGGYDPDQDNLETSYEIDNTGNAIYMVDAETGARLWWAGPSSSSAELRVAGMDNAIPAMVTVLDMDKDGLADRMYAADVGGRMFRFDIMNENPATSLVTGGKIASLGAADLALAARTPDTIRKFFYPVDVSIQSDANGSWINLAIGSGNRANPLGTAANDRFFVLRDPNVYNIPSNYTTGYGISVSSLYDATDDLIQEAATQAERDTELENLKNSKGWQIALNQRPGEKVLAESVTFDKKLIFTSFSPSSSNSSLCEADLGEARIYVVDIATAAATRNFDPIQKNSEEEFTVEDRQMILARSGIPPGLTIIFPEANEGFPIGLVGPEQVDIGLGDNLVRTYWRLQGN